MGGRKRLWGNGDVLDGDVIDDDALGFDFDNHLLVFDVDDGDRRLLQVWARCLRRLL